MAGGTPSLIEPAALMQRIVGEIAACRGILSRIEHVVHDLLPTPGQLHPVAVAPRTIQTGLQDIDLLDQVLDDLSRCLAALSGDASLVSATAVDGACLLAPLGLHDLRQRLRGEDAAATHTAKIHLF